VSAPSAFRVALYFAPELDDPLWTAGNRWLGRDPETGATLDRPTGIDIPNLTDEPALYGLHATLKPPMRLAPGTRYEDFAAAVSEMAASLSAFALPPLAVENLDGFLALREQHPSRDLQALADSAVATLDGFRQQPEAAELARRRRHGLTEAEDMMLERWGYPYVFQLWRFHITLSRRLDAGEMARVKPIADAYFAAALAYPRRLSSLAVFTQRAAGEPFLVAKRFPLDRTAAKEAVNLPAGR
jgi:putative phosphonate metabolism protein